MKEKIFISSTTKEEIEEILKEIEKFEKEVKENEQKK